MADPDAWIGRSHALQHHTGVHPLNGEPTLTALGEAGLWTPTELHFVRNHGRVPRIDPAKHVLSVEGLVQQPRTFSLAQLSAMPQVRVAASLSCDGNRRRELNQLRHTLGFNWSAGATACSWWTGVPVRELLLHACGGLVGDGAHFVCFEGSTDEELARGVYGASLPLAAVVSDLSDVMVATAMNDAPLTPDHGAPMRLLVPGHVGGRSVKWLTRIVVSPDESHSSYHREEHKVLPASVTNFSSASALYRQPEYSLYELNVNSVIFAPAHREWIDLLGGPSPYAIRGYAYAGGGRRVTRVEVTLDGGHTWDLADLKYPEAVPARHGLYVYCWCHWVLEVPRCRLLGAQEIACRAVDTAQNGQPEHPVWNLQGLMNNCWYRIRLKTLHNQPAKIVPRLNQHGRQRYRGSKMQEHPSVPAERQATDSILEAGEFERRRRDRLLRQRQDHQQQQQGDECAVQCCHPVVPGNALGGWMQLENSGGARCNVPLHRAVQSPCSRVFSPREIARHCREDDCWIVIDSLVLDVSPYLRDHPGGKHALLVHAGTDASHLFHTIHAQDAREIVSRFVIGRVSTSTGDGIGGPGAGPDGWQAVSLRSKSKATHDTLCLDLDLPLVPPGQHLLLGVEIAGEWVVRPYTPVVLADHHGRRSQLLVKVYDAHPDAGIPGGRMSTHLRDAVEPGSQLHIKGPCGDVMYGGRGTLLVRNDVLKLRHYSFIAGGTGITPVFGVIQALLGDMDTHAACVRLLYLNKTVTDVLLLQQLDHLEDGSNGRFQVHHVLSAPPLLDAKDGRTRSVRIGSLNARIIDEALFSPSTESAALICGPPGMMEAALGLLERAGFPENALVEF